jgi:hypothetical protein
MNGASYKLPVFPFILCNTSLIITQRQKSSREARLTPFQDVPFLPGELKPAVSFVIISCGGTDHCLSSPQRPVMDYDALKEQWSEIEERDGVRLSWNTFPSSRMVSGCFHLSIFPRPAFSGLIAATGSISPCGPHRCPLYSSQGASRLLVAAI